MNNFLKSQKEVENLSQLYQLAYTENNKDVIDDCEKNLKLLLSEIKITEVKCFLSNEADTNNIKFLVVSSLCGRVRSKLSYFRFNILIHFIKDTLL